MEAAELWTVGAAELWAVGAVLGRASPLASVLSQPSHHTHPPSLGWGGVSLAALWERDLTPEAMDVFLSADLSRGWQDRHSSQDCPSQHPVNIDLCPRCSVYPCRCLSHVTLYWGELPAPNRITILSYTASLPFWVWHGRLKHHTRSHDKVSRQGSHEAGE